MHKPNQDPNPEVGVLASLALMGGFALYMVIIVIGTWRESFTHLLNYLAH